MQHAPASGGQAGLVAAVEPTATERLDHVVGTLLAEKKPWPAFLTIAARATEEWEACPTPAHEALGWMTTTAVGVLDAASVGPLVPVCQAFKSLIEAVEGAAECQDKLKGLISRCAFLTTVLMQHDRGVGPLAQVQKPMKDFATMTNKLAAFTAKWAKGGKCREGLRRVSDDIALVDGRGRAGAPPALVGGASPIAPTLPSMAAVPSGAISLTDAHVSRPSLLRSAVVYLTKTALGYAPCVLTGMAGAGKPVLASAVVRDEKVREHFHAGMFWWRVGRDEKDQLQEFLEGLVLRVASSSGTISPVLRSAEEATCHLKAICTDAVSPRLVVLDDVWEREVVDALKLTGMQLLVTTRDRSVVSMPGECVEVGGMQEDEALGVLRVGCGAPKNLDLPRAQALQGKFTEAHRLFERALAIREGALGVDHPDTIMSRACVADLYTKQGLLDKAAPLLKEAVCSFERALGPDHPSVAAALNDRACLLQSQGKHAEAEPLYERPQAIREKVLGREHPDVATTLNDRASLLQRQGKYAEAEPLYERSQAIREKLLGREHPDVATTLNEWASLLQRQGKYAEAMPLYERSQAIREKVLGPEHPEVATTLNDWAGLLTSQGKYAEGKSLYERSQAISKKVLGPEHPRLATTLNGWANLLESQGKHDEADPLYVRALEILGATVGQEHPNYASTLNNRAGLLAARDEVEELAAIAITADSMNKTGGKFPWENYVVKCDVARHFWLKSTATVMYNNSCKSPCCW
ncbi:NB-ARC and TPR repeat-containing protein-likely pseudogene [Ectocarpus siliculosus]|nr:NB-ARC and TPR repeat-containing protein-likely pseudogene [Ectocarpus siliculosus]|eukprot:CBJ31695.1 NB-ARC and TPR repeat-containing protein-likely pseudogene [Ectocarpus siliculosus]